MSLAIAGGLCLSNSFCHAEFPKGGIDSDSTKDILQPTGHAIKKPIPNPAALPLALPDAPQRMQPVPPVFDTMRLTTSHSLDEKPEPLPVDRSQFLVNATAVITMLNAVRPGRPNSAKPAAELAHYLDEPWRYESYHWRGLIAQSLLFGAVESSFRIASDDQIRHLLARKPFWHDYSASIRHFNMNRWDDGDNFMVNYVGHPMQGAVSAFIEIQNDPTGRQQEISAKSDYWVSRFKGFLWATVFSVHSEISPLGEAGIGNEGGWTYPIAKCHRPCAIWNPETMHSTNNTGWVDFIITPTLGSVWMLAEDTIDRYVSDRLQGDNRAALFPNIVRGALNPSRTMANAMRFKAPWYRDFQHGLSPDRSRRGIHMLASDEETAASQNLRRFSFALHYRSTPFGPHRNPCILCGPRGGAGFEVDYAITRWISASVSLDKQGGLSMPTHLAISEIPASSTTGSSLIAGFGVRLMRDRPNNTLSLAIRPGVIIYEARLPAHASDKPIGGSYVQPAEYSITHTAATFLLSNDYKINRKLAIRSSFGATIVRYRTPIRDSDGIGTPPYISFLSHENFTNRTTWVWQGGPVVHF